MRFRRTRRWGDDARPRGAWKGAALLCLLLIGGFTGRALGEKPSNRAVEALRQAILYRAETEEAAKYREEMIRKRADALTTVNEMSQALLQLWGAETAGNLNDAFSEQVRQELAQRFAEAIRKAAANPSATSQIAAANYVGELISEARSSEVKSTFVRDNIGRLAPTLIELARSPDSNVQRAAVLALGKINPTPRAQAVTVIASLFDSKEVESRRVAAAAVGELMHDLSQLQREGRAIDLVRNQSDAESLQASEMVVQAVRRGLDDSDAEVRRLCVLALKEGAIALTDLLPELPQPRLPPDGKPITPEDKRQLDAYRQSVEESEKPLKPLMEAVSNSLPILLKLMNTDPQPVIRYQSSLALEEIAKAAHKMWRIRRVAMPPGYSWKPQAPTGRGDALADVALFQPEAAGSPDLSRTPLFVALKESLPKMVEGLSSPDARLRLAVASSIEDIGPLARPAIPSLIKALKDPSLYVRWTAIRTLGKLAPSDAAQVVPALAGDLNDSDLDIRIAVTEALYNFGTEAAPAVEALAAAVGTGDAEFRVAAMEALEATGPAATRAVPAIAATLENPEPRVRLKAAETLGNLSGLAREAVPALRKAQNDSNEDVRRAVNEALVSILSSDRPK